jgi:CHAT domain-containing protein
LFGPLVEQVRESIQEEPGPRSASGTALSLLQKGAKDLFGGGLEEKLAALRKAGKDHLCICPHGPYHFYPYHLIGPEDHPLAAEWSVTYLPNLRLLDPARRVTQPREPFIAIGLDFPESNSRGLPALSGPEAEAIEIAALTHAPSLTGTAVTESSVVDAFTCYRRIHLGTHGDLNVSAPSFQCLYLSPAAGGDVLNAYEILRLDLSGVDLVTLSACETALGRIDLGDNPRGIPASLLLAGVSTIIGTLWPVETNAARLFFTAFYSHLKGTVTKGEAFHVAQEETRERLPQYRDWGAFYLIGAVV